MFKRVLFLLSLVFPLVVPIARADGLNLQARWVYCAYNLWTEDNVKELEGVMRRAAKDGYTGILLHDAKFSKLGDMDERYFKNIERIKSLATELNLEIVPTLFEMGYSNSLLWHDPNLVEAMPVRDALFVVKNGEAKLQADPPVEVVGGDFSNLRLWTWHDQNVVPDNGAVRITDPNGNNARIVQRLVLRPFRQYHLSIRIKTQDFKSTPEIKILAGKSSLNHTPLGVKPTQDWTTHHIVFNSLGAVEAQLYVGVWGGETGSCWFDDAKIEEVGLLNIVHRPGAPMVVKRDIGGVLEPGKDYEVPIDPRMGTVPWKGSYEVWHEPPTLKTSLPEGTRLRVSYYHAITVNDDQAMICPSEPKTIELLRDEARRVHAAWGAKGYMMSHDEIRVLNWCGACMRRNLDAGQILADNVRTCVKILREVNPGGKIYVWNDMFDPNHNAKNDYYLVRGSLSRSWEGLDKGVVIVNWNFDKREDSLKWFAARGHEQIIAGYYDSKPDRLRQWLDTAGKLNGITGVMYTTWRNKYSDLEAFADILKQSAASPKPTDK